MTLAFSLIWISVGRNSCCYFSTSSLFWQDGVVMRAQVNSHRDCCLRPLRSDDQPRPTNHKPGLKVVTCSVRLINDERKIHFFIFVSFRMDSEHSKEVLKPYDWTYTTDYRGTLIGEDMQIQVGHSPTTISPAISLNSWCFLEPMELSVNLSPHP